MSHHVDGIIVNGRRTDDRPPVRDTGGIPVVYALSGSTNRRDCSVVADDAGGADLLDAAPDVDAVVCGSDQIARGVLDTLREHGRRVPDDVAVVGIDNWSVMTDDARPALTSVDLGIETIGRVAARCLLSAIDGERPPRRTVVPPRLVVRDSS